MLTYNFDLNLGINLEILITLLLCFYVKLLSKSKTYQFGNFHKNWEICYHNHRNQKEVLSARFETTKFRKIKFSKNSKLFILFIFPFRINNGQQFLPMLLYRTSLLQKNEQYFWCLSVIMVPQPVKNKEIFHLAESFDQNTPDNLLTFHWEYGVRFQMAHIPLK